MDTSYHVRQKENYFKAVTLAFRMEFSSLKRIASYVVRHCILSVQLQNQEIPINFYYILVVITFAHSCQGKQKLIII